ncbi:MAG: bifunctional [glutamate--ammonia ligase]-adenylyl-L-tyrosine phosphorylase/[glutamate--ammonia-ligase] adenylyltransferase [Pseudomonadota bacterium]
MSDQPYGDIESQRAAGIAHHRELLTDLPTALDRDKAAELAWLSEYVSRYLLAPHVNSLLVAALSEGATNADTIYRAAAADSPDDPMRALRSARHALHIATLWSEWLEREPLEQSFQRLSAAADAAIRFALDHATSVLIERHGQLCDTAGRRIDLAVLAMGKLGGEELNFSSDIDLVLLYRADGVSDGQHSLSASQYFTRLARELIRHLDQHTADGFVYRVDVRLRPFGASGPLVVSFNSFEQYLETHGRDWERYAYLKARLVNADADPDNELAGLLDRFVYRRYLDFGMFGSLRELKEKIAAGVKRRDSLDDLKLGPGGIREIEFIVQSLQLIRGGREPQLKKRRLLAALDALVALQHIEVVPARELADAYALLRRLENAVQGRNDAQTHRLPDSDIARTKIAAALGLASVPQLLADLSQQRNLVQRQFNASELAPSQPEPTKATAWPTEKVALAATLQALGVEAATDIAAGVTELRQTATSKRLDALAETRLNALIPLLLDELPAQATPLVVWRRLSRVLEATLRRSAYLALLLESEPTRQSLVHWVSQSPYLARELAAAPVLLDELAGRGSESAATRGDMRATLAVQLTHQASDDIDAKLRHVAEYQRIGRFRVALLDEGGALPVMRVSDALTSLAEALIDTTHQIAWQENLARYGTPSSPAFAVIAYGKLGGFELGYGSDLDLVFIHDATSPDGMTDGLKPIANDQFFARHVRKLIHYLTYQTTHGPMYDVDVRLRPSGRSGLLVTSLAAFARYQREQAWTWEHQALLRARAIVGDTALCAQFEDVRRQVLVDAVRRDSLCTDVAAMRERMRTELAAGGPDQFDLKQDAGGIADIEFIVQYLILRDAAADPAVLTFTDNMRQLDMIAERGCLDPSAARDLQSVYLAYRQTQHHRSLSGADSVLDGGRFADERALVRGLWHEVFSP